MTEAGGELISITIEVYRRLAKDSEILQYLMAAGINNTTAYEEGMRMYYEENPDGELAQENEESYVDGE